MTFNEIERQGYLQGEANGRDECRAEGIAQSVTKIKESVQDGLITPDIAEKLITSLTDSLES